MGLIAGTAETGQRILRGRDFKRPGRVTNSRPGLIVGPGDPTGRFTYWPVRVARGGQVLAPGTGNDPVQFIDARDHSVGLTHSPPADTIKATLDWYDDLPDDSRQRSFGNHGVKPDREREVIEAWKTRQK